MGTSGIYRMIDVATLGVLVLALVGTLFDRVRVRVRVPASGRPRLPVAITGSLSLLGFLMTMASPAGATGKRIGTPLPGSRRAPDAPWTETGGFPSPRPPVEARDTGPVIETPDSRPPWTVKPTIHPAIHSGTPRSARITPLFPRHVSGSQSLEKDDRRVERDSADAEREESMRRHPAGKDLRSDRLPRLHRVRHGESLWSIAESALGTTEPVRIARYWHKVHHANREVIGSDPNILFPGQQLTLPAESA